MTLSTKWKTNSLYDITEINPTETLKKGDIAKHIAMESLKPFSRKVANLNKKRFSGGVKFRNNDTLLARITPSLENGKTALVDVLEKNEIGFGSTEFIVIRAIKENSDPKFLYYFVTSPRFRAIAISSMTGTSGRQRVQTDLISNKSFMFPELPEQKEIAGVLSSLDDKIELLQKQNETLEQVAQAIFKEWFVEFNFPDKDGKPYKKSGGKITGKGGEELPEGWEVKELEEISNVVCGKTPSKSNSDFFGGDVPFIKIPDMHNQIFVISTQDTLSESGKNSQQNKTIPAYSICVSCIATVGLVSITTKNSQTNQQINSIVSNENYYRYFIYFAMKNKKKQLIDMASGGTATLNLNTGNFLKIEIRNPTEKVLKTFNSIVDPIFEKIFSNSREIEILSKNRDTLLPKLMTGELRIKT